MQALRSETDGKCSLLGPLEAQFEAVKSGREYHLRCALVFCGMDETRNKGYKLNDAGDVVDNVVVDDGGDDDDDDI